MGEGRIFFCGPFPGVVTGQTVTTEFLFSRLALKVEPKKLVRLDVSRANVKKRFASYGIRLARVAKALYQLAVRPHKSDTVYLSVDANRGMIVTIALAQLTSLRGAELVLHHHTAAHIDRPSALMRALVRASGSAAVHLTICDAMSQALVRRYPEVRHTAALSNIVHVRGEQDLSTRTDSHFKLGFMSKLVEEKGLFIALDLLKALRAAGIEASLHLAGAFPNDATRQSFSDRAGEYIKYIVQHGFLDQAGKQQFFAELDLFVFPTIYANETQGIVNLEALANGVPVAAYGRCCIPGDLESSGGLVVPPDADFVTETSVFIRDLISNHGQLDAAKQASRNRFLQLRGASEAQLQAFDRLLIGRVS
ncbi:glycosyltransferase family 4 protein [Devosia chinhatensis]|uniref:glycosyltransferase family 4 protein n=1 Tax=Devosia chinhatensis TaxID=429727 RepID=UPI0006972E83|nr:glycosyltransferase family 4 protein [Devosia chinhatensis]